MDKTIVLNPTTFMMELKSLLTAQKVLLTAHNHADMKILLLVAIIVEVMSAIIHAKEALATLVTGNTTCTPTHTAQLTMLKRLTIQPVAVKMVF